MDSWIWQESWGLADQAPGWGAPAIATGTPPAARLWHRNHTIMKGRAAKPRGGAILTPRLLWIPPWTLQRVHTTPARVMPPQLESCHPGRCLRDPRSELPSEPQPSRSCATSATDIWTPASLAMDSGTLCVSCYTSHELQDPEVCCAILAVGSRTTK